MMSLQLYLCFPLHSLPLPLLLQSDSLLVQGQERLVSRLKILQQFIGDGGAHSVQVVVRHPHRGGVERVGHVASCGGGPVQQLEVLEGVVRTRQFPRDTQCVELRLRQDILQVLLSREVDETGRGRSRSLIVLGCPWHAHRWTSHVGHERGGHRRLAAG